MSASIEHLERARERSYVFKHKLGAGGMGFVYRAHDPVRDVDVALKLLRGGDGSAVYRFKYEFRALANIVHRNLVSLYELHAVGPSWFFTMELVDGVGFLEHVRPHQAPSETQPSVLDSALTRTVEGPPADLDSVLATMTGEAFQAARVEAERKYHVRRQAIIDATLDVPRLRDSLRQLCEGVAALHRARKLHRDLKPSNVMVDRSGRVVVLDFGLVMDRDEQKLDGDLKSGTPAYMSPEQADGRPLTEASDWYAVGCMLYEALTGELPFSGSTAQMLDGKRNGPPPRPRQRRADVPADLDELCARLLARAPEARPAAAELLATVGAGGAAELLERPIAAGEVAFVGRADELARLERAFATVRETGRSATLVVRGRSGIGKSALIERFLQHLVGQAQPPLVLAGRCYERESLPYKALDAIVDGLAEFLCSLPDDDVGRLLPDGVDQLVRLFPVLERVPLLSPKAATRRPSGDAAAPTADPALQRRLAAAAFCELLGRLGETRPVVVYIDDLQWGDIDSIGFLTALWSHERPRRLLLVASYRADEEESSELLRTIRERLRDRGQPDGIEVLEIAPLTDADARALVRQIAAGADLELAAKLAADSGGSPFLLTELVRAGAHAGAGSAGEAPSIEAVLHQHVATLGPEARNLLKAVCVAGRPIAATLAGRVAKLANEISAATSLRGERLARLRHAGTGVQIEPYHDRVREAIVARLPADELQSWHRRLAEALEAVSDSDAEALAEHWHGAGEPTRAAPYALVAARRAEAALAFAQAAHMYRLALAGAAALSDPENVVRLRLAKVLANAGRGTDAAEQYLRAAEGADLKLATECRVRAAEHVLTSGDIKRGLGMLSELGRELGLVVPRNQSGAMARFMWERLKLRLNGLRYREKPAASVPMKKLLRIDLCHAATTVGMVDPLRGAYFATLQLRDALQAGEPWRVARALAHECCFRGTFPKEREQARRWMARAKEIATRLDDRWLHAWNCGVEALIAHMEGRYALCEELSQQSLAVMNRIPEVQWAVAMAEDTRIWNLHRMGAPQPARRQYEEVLARTRDHGDRLLEKKLRSNSARLWLAQDRVDLALRDLDESRVYFTRWFHLRGQAEIALYRGEARVGMEQLEREVAAILKKWRRFFLVESVRVEYLWLRARMTLAAALEDATGREALLARCATQLRTLRRERHLSVPAWAALVDGGLALARGDRERAVAQFAIATADEVVRDMPLCAHAAEWRLGVLLGGDEGAARHARASAWFAGEAVIRPERMLAVVAPA